MNMFRRVQVLGLGMLAVGSLMGGCAADRPAPTTPSQKEIRADSDRFHDKMKQEEREHGKSVGAPVR